MPNVPKLKREQPLPLFEMTCTVGLSTKRLDPCQNSWELLGVCQARAVLAGNFFGREAAANRQYHNFGSKRFSYLFDPRFKVFVSSGSKRFSYNKIRSLRRILPHPTSFVQPTKPAISHPLNRNQVTETDDVDHDA